MTEGKIRVGIGGWTFPEWRGTFYPDDLVQKRELQFASRKFGAIEINSTFYGRQSVKSWTGWEKEVPDDFQFALKGSRYCVTRPKLADTEEALGHYFAQGMDALGSKLGPILWMLAARRSFDREDIARFLNRLPTSLGGRPLQHAIEPRHESFRDAKFFGLCRDHDIAVVFGDDAKFPLFDVETASFAYARLQNMHEELANGYDPHDLDRFAEKARDWRKAGRNAFIFMINGAKIRAPAAALALQERLR